MRNEPGTLDDESTVTGQPFTVNSNGSDGGRQVPRVVNLMEGQAETLTNQASNGKRVKIFVVPDWNEGFSAYCFQFIGQGASFCTAKNCMVVHQGGAVMSVTHCDVFVCKSTTKALFIDPRMSSTKIYREALDD